MGGEGQARVCEARILLHGEAPLCATYLAAAGLGCLLHTGGPPELSAHDPRFELRSAAPGALVVQMPMAGLCPSGHNPAMRNSLGDFPGHRSGRTMVSGDRLAIERHDVPGALTTFECLVSDRDRNCPVPGEKGLAECEHAALLASKSAAASRITRILAHGPGE